MTRCIQERQLLTIDSNLIRTNMLRNATMFTIDNLRFTNRIQQTGLTMVDMTHDRNDW